MKAPPLTTLAIVTGLAGCSGGTLNESTGQLLISGLPTGGAEDTVIITPSYNASTSQLGFPISLTIPPPPSNTVGVLVHVEIDLAGASLQPGTYTNSSSSVMQASATVTEAYEWAAYTHASGKTDQGSFTLTISATGPSSASGSNVNWEASHGSFSATLPPAPGNLSLNNVGLSVTF